MEAVAAVGKPTVLVFLNGSAVSVNWAAQHIPAIVEAWYSGQAEAQPSPTSCSVTTTPPAASPSPFTNRPPTPSLRRLQHERPHLPFLHRPASVPFGTASATPLSLSQPEARLR